MRDGWGLLLSCDLPLLDRMILDRLVAGRSADVHAVAFAGADRDGSLHACCALYHTWVLPNVEKELSQRCRLQVILQSVNTRVLIPTSAESRGLTNVNTMEDLSFIGLEAAHHQPAALARNRRLGPLLALRAGQMSRDRE